jgi:hypothetical protein
MGAGKKEQARGITAFPTTTTLFRVQTHHRPSLHAWKDRENRAQDKKRWVSIVFIRERDDASLSLSLAVHI